MRATIAGHRLLMAPITHGQYARYCALKSALRWTNAVSCAGTLLMMAPPKASKLIRALERRPETRACSTWRMAIPIASRDKGLLKKSDFAAYAARPTLPLGASAHSSTDHFLQPASASIACRWLSVSARRVGCERPWETKSSISLSNSAASRDRRPSPAPSAPLLKRRIAAGNWTRPRLARRAPTTARLSQPQARRTTATPAPDG